MLTVISWFAARKGRKPLHEIVESALTDKPTLVAIVSDQYTTDTRLRPFVPLSERFGERLDIILAAEWRQEDRERDGEVLLRRLGLVEHARPQLLRDQGGTRTALLLKQRRPVALVDLWFLERGEALSPGQPDPREAQMRAEEEALVAALEEILGRLPARQPLPPRTLQSGEHDFASSGICQRCGDGMASLRTCPGTRRDEGPRRDRFELIELD